METNKIHDDAHTAFNMLNDLSYDDKVFIMNAFRNQGVHNYQESRIIKVNEKYCQHVDIAGFTFTTESEARLAAALIEFSKDSATQASVIIKVFPVLLTLLGSNSEWSLQLTETK